MSGREERRGVSLLDATIANDRVSSTHHDAPGLRYSRHVPWIIKYIYINNVVTNTSGHPPLILLYGAPLILLDRAIFSSLCEVVGIYDWNIWHGLVSKYNHHHNTLIVFRVFLSFFDVFWCHFFPLLFFLPCTTNLRRIYLWTKKRVIASLK